VNRYVVAHIDDLAAGQLRHVEAGGKPICLIRSDAGFFALADICPHAGARLSAGRLTGTVVSEGPGSYRLCRFGEMLRCPWHGWEFDIQTGQSWSDPDRTRVRSFKANTASGRELVRGPYMAESIRVVTDETYVYVEL
jgi:nitrite reductase/ring-hydroxylating ferredoxin subunit